jgi:hypothetical protein
MEQILVFNLVDNEAGQNEPDISIHGRVIFAVANNILIRCQIPEGGLGYGELMDIAVRLRVRSPWLAEQLNHPQYNGIAGPIVAEVAQINRMDVNRVADQIIREANQARIRELLFRRFRPERLAEPEVRRQPRIEAVVEEVDESQMDVRGALGAAPRVGGGESGGPDIPEAACNAELPVDQFLWAFSIVSSR